MNYQLSTIFIAYILDLVLGDPQWRWHPVRLIGRLIERLEVRLNPIRNTAEVDKGGKISNGVNTKLRINKIFSGTLLIILVVGVVIFCAAGILSLSKFIHPFFYYLLSTLSVYFALSVKALGVEAGSVKDALINKDIQKARNKLSMIVGRDTERLDESEIIRASVETVAESTMDGIVAPLFYAFLGGPVLAWFYKAVNTLDSMVGYRSERFIEFGKPSAALDGLMNFIPARITYFLISISSLVLKKDAFGSIRWGWRYFLKGTEDNSHLTEAAMAGALGVQLGGVNFYKSVPSPRPYIGDRLHPLEAGHIRQSIRIAYISSALFLIIGVVLILCI